uniref:Fibroblast growth factor receptor 1 n=2 Tax=Rhipicephalus TaxID=426455 RepID=A0A131YMC0_RHIAP
MNGRLAHVIPRSMVPLGKAIRSCCCFLAFLCAVVIFPVVTATSMPPPIGTFQALQAPESAEGANSVPREVIDTRAKTERLPDTSTEIELTNATDTSGHLERATENVAKNLSKIVATESASPSRPANVEEDDTSFPDDDSTPASAGPSSSEESRMEALRAMESVTIRPEEAVVDAKDQQQTFPKENSGTLVARGPEPDRSRRPEYDFDNPTSGGTNVYIVAIVGVVPAAGAVIWCVRKMIAKKRENKENPDAPPAEEDDKQTVAQDPPTKYSYIQDAYNKMYAKTIGELMPTSSAPPHPRASAPVASSPDEVPRDDVRLERVLGEGNFGRVWKATAYGLNGSKRSTPVAVKTLKEYATNEEKRDLVREMGLMRKLGQHPHVVRFLGCCTLDEPPLLIMELVSRGKLQSFLREHRSQGAYYNEPEDDGCLGPRDLAQFALQVAQGMDYIHRNGIIHRDLAARNVLVDEHSQCKVADFGLSRSVRDSETDVYQQKSKGALPVRWMAPECLYLQVFTTKSDVWAFGILLWEIVTLGSTPYPGLSAQEVIHAVRDGRVMAQPVHCRWELYRLMRACWHPDPKERPPFSKLATDLDQLIKLNAGYIDLDNFPEHAYYNLEYGVDEKL